MLAITAYVIGLNNEIQLTNIMMHSGFPVLLNKAVWWVSEQGDRQITIASNGMRLITELGGETFLKNPSSQKIKMH